MADTTISSDDEEGVKYILVDEEKMILQVKDSGLATEDGNEDDLIVDDDALEAQLDEGDEPGEKNDLEITDDLVLLMILM